MQCRPKEKIFAWPTRWPARFSPPSSLRRPSIWRGTANPRGLRHLQSSCDTGQRCSVRQPDDNTRHPLPPSLIRASLPFEIDGIHPRLSLPPLAVNRAVFPLGHRSRESHRCSSCNNTTTELGGKSLALSLSFPPAFNRFVVEGRL